MTYTVERRRLLAVAMAIAVAVATLPASMAASRGDQPARPSAEDDLGWGANLRYAGEFAGFRIASAVGYQRALDVSREQQPSPDIVFTSPGGIEPPPSPCILPSPDVVRCPLQDLRLVTIQLGTQDDSLTTKRYDNPSLAGFILNLQTGAGNDRWVGGPGAERWNGGPGNDNAKAGGGNDKVIGGDGNDRMFGGLGIDFFLGGRGNDFARGGPADDKGFGGPGDDNFKD